MTQKSDPLVAVVIPVKDEAENIAELLSDIVAACASYERYEVVAVDDGSTDLTATIVSDMARENPAIRLIQHNQSGGQSAAVHTGVHASRAKLICTLDGDGQNPPHEIPKLLAPFMGSDVSTKLGLVAGQRVDRQDTKSKLWASKFANKIRGWILKDGTRDTGCGLKAFRRDVFIAMPFFNHMHRYLPALFKAHGWEIAHVDVIHKARDGGRSKYSNLQRGLVGIVDLIGVSWLLRRVKKAHPLPEDQK